MNANNLSKIFNLPAVNTAIEEKKAIQGTILDVDPEDNDFDFTREKLIKIVNTGMDTLNDVTDIATRSQDVKAYDALAKVMTAVTNAAKTLADVNEKKNTIKNREAAKTGNTNIMMVGSTADLMQMLKEMKQKQIDG